MPIISRRRRDTDSVLFSHYQLLPRTERDQLALEVHLCPGGGPEMLYSAKETVL